MTSISPVCISLFIVSVDLSTTLPSTLITVSSCNFSKSLKFLSINGLYKALGFEKRNKSYPQLTDHYFTGDYPVELVDELGDNKITQLSLLSSVSKV